MAKKICVLGAGRMGALHARNIAAHPRAEVHSIIDVRGEAAEALAAEVGVRHGDDIAVAFTDAAIDAVLIATSTDTHAELISRAAAAGKPIFCEKPIDLALQKVEACLKDVQAAAIPFQIGFNRRFDLSFGALRERLHNDTIGKLELVKITSRDPSPPPLSYVRVSGGLFRDMMIHDFDTARWLLGEEPVELVATASNLVDPAIGEAGDIDTAVVTMRTHSGVICTIENSRRAVYGYDQRIEVLGSKGMLQAHNPLPTTVTRSDAQGISSDVLMDFAFSRYAEAFRRELDGFIEVLEGRAEPSPNAQDGRAALVLAEAALSSLSSGRRVEVAL